MFSTTLTPALVRLLSERPLANPDTGPDKPVSVINAINVLLPGAPLELTSIVEVASKAGAGELPARKPR